MQVIVESRLSAAEPLRRYAQRRTVFVLRRIVWRVPRARISLADLNGPRGGVDKQCQVELLPAGHGAVVARATASTWREALHLALERAMRALKRLFGRSRAASLPARQHRPDPAELSSPTRRGLAPR